MIDIAIVEPNREAGAPYWRRAIINTDECTQPNFRSCRDIFVYCGLVIKAGGGSQTERELATWQKVTEEDKKYFHAIVAHGKTKRGQVWIAQEFAIIQSTKELHPELLDENGDPLPGKDGGESPLWLKEQEYYNELHEVLNKYSIYDMGGSGGGNWGYINGQVKVYDWGCSG
jgi:hypothetical protein